MFGLTTGNFGSGGSSVSWYISDADGDTVVTTERTADDDTIRFDLGGATPITDAATFNQTDGFQFNTGQDNLDFAVSTQATSKYFFIDGDGDSAYINGSTPMTYSGNTLDAKLVIRRNDSDFSVGIGTLAHSDTSNRAGLLFGGRTRGSEGAETATVDGDTLFDFAGVGYTGTDYALAGSIQFSQDGAISGGAVPGKIDFSVVNPAIGTQAQSRLTIYKDSVVVNENSDAAEFRVEGISDEYLMHNDGTTDTMSFGTETTSFTVNALTVKPKMLVDRGGGDSNINFVCLSNRDASSAGSFMVWARSRGSGTSATTYTSVLNGDRLGVFRCDAHDGTEFITCGDFSFQANATVSTGIVPTMFSVRLMDASGNLFTAFQYDYRGRMSYLPSGGTKIAFYEDGGIRANLTQSTSGLSDFIYYSGNYTNCFRIDTSADQVNISNSANTQGGLFSADAANNEVRINKFNTDCNLVVESSVSGTDLWATDTTNDEITQGNTIFSSRYQGLKGSDVASASQVTLGDGNFFDITGTTTIDYITTDGWQAGSIVTLQFDGSLTVMHNTAPLSGSTGPFMLSGSANFAATANDTLTLIYNGSKWYEVARTVI